MDSYWKLTQIKEEIPKHCVLSVQHTYKTVKLKCIQEKKHGGVSKSRMVYLL